jgi:methionyl-tRNA formyltransferase
MGNLLLKEILPDWFAGRITPKPQDQAKATYTWRKDIAKEKAQITKATPIELAERMVRAFNPWPIAWLEVNVNGSKKRLKLYQVKVSGEVFPEKMQLCKKDKELYLALENGSLLLEELQLEGKNLGTSKDYLFLSGAALL